MNPMKGWEPSEKAPGGYRLFDDAGNLVAATEPSPDGRSVRWEARSPDRDLPPRMGTSPSLDDARFAVAGALFELADAAVRPASGPGANPEESDRKMEEFMLKWQIHPGGRAATGKLGGKGVAWASPSVAHPGRWAWRAMLPGYDDRTGREADLSSAMRAADAAAVELLEMGRLPSDPVGAEGPAPGHPVASPVGPAPPRIFVRPDGKPAVPGLGLDWSRAGERWVGRRRGSAVASVNRVGDAGFTWGAISPGGGARCGPASDEEAALRHADRLATGDDRGTGMPVDAMAYGLDEAADPVRLKAGDVVRGPDGRPAIVCATVDARDNASPGGPAPSTAAADTIAWEFEGDEGIGRDRDRRPRCWVNRGQGDSWGWAARRSSGVAIHVGSAPSRDEAVDLAVVAAAGRRVPRARPGPIDWDGLRGEATLTRGMDSPNAPGRWWLKVVAPDPADYDYRYDEGDGPGREAADPVPVEERTTRHALPRGLGHLLDELSDRVRAAADFSPRAFLHSHGVACIDDEAAVRTLARMVERSRQADVRALAGRDTGPAVAPPSDWSLVAFMMGAGFAPKSHRDAVDLLARMAKHYADYGSHGG